MRHYCNRQTPRVSNAASGIQPNNSAYAETAAVAAVKSQMENIPNTETYPIEDEEIVLPPACDPSMLEEIGKRVRTYVPGSTVSNDKEPDNEYIYNSEPFESGSAVSYDDNHNNVTAQGGSITQGGGYNKQESISNPFEYARRIADCTNVLSSCPTDCMCSGNTACSIAEHETGIFADDTSGSFGLFSVPSPNRGNLPMLSMAEYLKRYKGKHICLDLWTTDCTHCEKCGTLTDIGQTFLVIYKPCTGEFTMIDLKTIKYISVYCK